MAYFVCEGSKMSHLRESENVKSISERVPLSLGEFGYYNLRLVENKKPVKFQVQHEGGYQHINTHILTYG